LALVTWGQESYDNWVRTNLSAEGMTKAFARWNTTDCYNKGEKEPAMQLLNVRSLKKIS